MERRTSRSLAFDLVDTDLADPVSLTKLVVDHTLAPFRAACDLAAPEPGEQLGDVLGEVTFGDELTITTYRSWSPRPEPDIFDSVLRGMLLFSWLFPASMFRQDRDGRLLESPGQQVIANTHWLLMRTWDEIADLVAGALGLPTNPALSGLRRPMPGQPALEPFANPMHRPEPNPDAIAELAKVRQLVARSLDLRPEPEPVVNRIATGLDQMGWWPAHYIDQTLRADVRPRLVWFGHLELELAVDDDGEPLPRSVRRTATPSSRRAS